MKTQQQDLFHGAALMQVVEDPQFKALNKAGDGKYGHYVLNNDTRLFVKYTTGAGPEGCLALLPTNSLTLPHYRSSLLFSETEGSPW